MMVNVFPALHAERDQTAPHETPDQNTDQAHEVDEYATLGVNLGHAVVATLHAGDAEGHSLEGRLHAHVERGGALNVDWLLLLHVLLLHGLLLLQIRILLQKLFLLFNLGSRSKRVVYFH